MKTTVNGSEKSTGKVNHSAVNGKAGNKNEQPKANALPVSKEFDGKAKDESPKTETPVQANEQPKAQVAAEQPTGAKAEVKEPVKPALNLESTLKLVEELHRRKIQRDKLINTIDTLEAFEVAQKDDAEETDSNHFQGCELTIEDDNQREFSTKNPYIINKVAEYINALCLDRLTEIESGISLPV